MAVLGYLGVALAGIALGFHIRGMIWWRYRSWGNYEEGMALHISVSEGGRRAKMRLVEIREEEP